MKVNFFVITSDGLEGVRDDKVVWKLEKGVSKLKILSKCFIFVRNVHYRPLETPPPRDPQVIRTSTY